MFSQSTLTARMCIRKVIYTVDGVYLISPDNQTAFPVHCNMSVDCTAEKV